jgi:hypothetical protein
MTVVTFCLALAMVGCSAAGYTPEQLNALKGDGACVGVVGSINQPVYGTGGLGIARLNSPGTITVAKDGTISCTITTVAPGAPQ